MDPETLSGLIKDPCLLDESSLPGLEEAISRFPWFQTVQMLYAINLFRVNDPRFSHQLRKAAVYAADRRKLKYWIDEFRQKLEPVPEPVAEEILPEEVLPEEIISEEILEEGIGDVPEIPAQEEEGREQLLNIIRSRLAEIEEERKKSEPAPHAESAAGENEREPELDLGLAPLPPRVPRKQLSKAELIEKFIREEPRISTPKAAFFNPTESSLRSNLDDDEIVSETLAMLYLQQGNRVKAIKIYEKLSLLFPEKSSYFAAQIAKMGP